MRIFICAVISYLLRFINGALAEEWKYTGTAEELQLPEAPELQNSSQVDLDPYFVGDSFKQVNQTVEQPDWLPSPEAVTEEIFNFVAALNSEGSNRSSTRMAHGGTLQTIKKFFQRPSLAKVFVVLCVLAISFLYSGLLVKLAHIVITAWFIVKILQLVD